MLSVISSACAAEERFYLGTFTGRAGSEGIYTGTINSESGTLGPISLAAPCDSPGFLASSPDGKFLYAADQAGVGAFAVRPDGSLTLLNNVSSGGSGACHLWVDATGRDVLVANYGSGNVACIQTNPGGSLGKQTSSIQFAGSGPDPKRQQKPFAHSIYTDPANRVAYSCDLGSDNIWVMNFDAGKGMLTLAEPPAVRVPPGSGPRHLALHPNGKFAYSVNELDLSVTTFARNGETGALTALDTVSALDSGASREGATAAEIFCHPSGKWLYSSNRGPDSISVFSIAADGHPALLEAVRAQVKTPRGFGIDPAGRWLIAAGQEDGKIAVFRIDQETGLLTPAGKSAPVPSPVCVLFAPGAGR